MERWVRFDARSREVVKVMVKVVEVLLAMMCCMYHSKAK